MPGGERRRTFALPENPVTQRGPSSPLTIPNGAEPAVGNANSLKWPSVVTRPMLLAASSANHSAPSDPTVIPCGLLPAVGGENSVKPVPLVLIVPILLGLLDCSTSDSENHRLLLPAGPAVIIEG